MTLTKYLLTSCCFLYTLSLSAQPDTTGISNQITISGQLTDVDDIPVSFARVIAWSTAKDKEIGQTYSSSEGNYTLVIPKDSIDLSGIDLIFSATGIKTVHMKLNNFDHPKIHQDISMRLGYGVVDCHGMPVTDEILIRRMTINSYLPAQQMR